VSQATVSQVPSPPADAGSTGYWLVLRDRWLAILAAVGVALAVAALVAQSATKRYQAETDLLVSPIASSDDTFVGTGLLQASAESRSALTVARFVRTPQVAAAVATRIGGDPARLLNSVKVQPQGQSSIVTVVARAGTPARAAAIANTFADVAIAQRTQQFHRAINAELAQLSKRLAKLRKVGGGSTEAGAIASRIASLTPFVGVQDPTLQVSSPAVPRNHQVWPRTNLAIAVGGLAALLLATAAVLGFELIAPRVRDERQLSSSRLPVLARVPRMTRHDRRRFLAGHGTLPADVFSSYGQVAADLADNVAPSLVLAVDTAIEDGKTITAVNVAALVARTGRRTILVDADYSNPRVADVFGLPVKKDLMDLVNGTDVRRIAIPVPGLDDALSVVPLKSANATRFEDWFEGFVFAARDFVQLLTKLRAHADLVIVNTPESLDANNLSPLAAAADGVLVAVQLGATSRKRFADLERTLCANAGIVLFSRGRARGRGATLVEEGLELGRIEEMPQVAAGKSPLRRARSANSSS
jgi:Mrp family chromosome partitioning ATPase